MKKRINKTIYQRGHDLTTEKRANLNCVNQLTRNVNGIQPFRNQHGCERSILLPLKVLRYGAVNDQVMDGLTPGDWWRAGDDSVYVVFYACDPKLPGDHKTDVNDGLLNYSFKRQQHLRL